MEYREYCEEVQQRYPRRHPHLSDLRDSIFNPAFLRAVRAGTPAALRAVCQELRPGVYAFDMLQPTFCRELLEEVERFERWMASADLPVVRPNTMNNYGAILDTFG